MSETKGPNDAEWGDDAREERGAVVILPDDPSGYTRNENGELVDDAGELVKGPDAAQWGDG